MVILIHLTNHGPNYWYCAILIDAGGRPGVKGETTHKVDFFNDSGWNHYTFYL